MSNTASPGAASGAPTRSALVAWTLRLFGFFQGLAILRGIVNLAMPTLLLTHMALSLPVSCIENFAMVPVVLSIMILMLAKKNRYHPAARRLGKIVVAHFLVAMVLAGIVGVLLFVQVLSEGLPRVNDPQLMEKSMATLEKAVANHPVSIRTAFALILLIEVTFTVLLVGAVRQLRDSHFAAPEAVAVETAAAPAAPPISGTPGA